MRVWPALLVATLIAAPGIRGVHAASDGPPPVGYSPLASTDEAGLWMTVDAAEKGTQQSPLLVKDEAINAYLHSVVCKLAGPQCASIRLYLVDVPEFNASCYPNGMLHIWTGLLLRAENEAQLAFVLGHELTHYLKRHTLNAYQARRDTSNGLALLSLGVAAVGVRYNMDLRGAYDLVQLTAVGALFAYSRDQEREADSGGFDLAVANGYDARQGAVIWGNFEAEEQSNPHRDKPSLFLSDHPTNKERLQTMSKRADDVSAGANAAFVGREEFLAAMRPYRAKWLDEELNRGELDSSIALIKRLLLGEPQSGQFKYYLAEAYRRRNHPGDLLVARKTYEDALTAENAPSETYRGLGLVSFKSGDRERAISAFQEYLARSPKADDRSMVELYLSNAGGHPQTSDHQ